MGTKSGLQQCLNPAGSMPLRLNHTFKCIFGWKTLWTVHSPGSSENNSVFSGGQLYRRLKCSEEVRLYLWRTSKHDGQLCIFKAALWKRDKCKSLIIGFSWQRNNCLVYVCALSNCKPKASKNKQRKGKEVHTLVHIQCCFDKIFSAV